MEIQTIQDRLNEQATKDAYNAVDDLRRNFRESVNKLLFDCYYDDLRFETTIDGKQYSLSLQTIMKQVFEQLKVSAIKRHQNDLGEAFIKRVARLESELTELQQFTQQS